VNRLNDGKPYLESLKPLKDFSEEPFKKESKKGVEIWTDKNDKNGVEEFGCRYPNGDAYEIKGNQRFCTLKGQKYDSRYDNHFDDIVKQLNNGNPSPHYLEPYKHFFKEAVKHDGLDVVDVYKKSLENLTNRKLRKKVENIVKRWLKRINSKRYRKYGLVSDDVYRAAYKVLDNGHVNGKNIAKKVNEKIEEFSSAQR